MPNPKKVHSGLRRAFKGQSSPHFSLFYPLATLSVSTLPGIATHISGSEHSDWHHADWHHADWHHADLHPIPMIFGFLKSNPSKKLEKQYQAKLTEGVELQRKGDIRGFARCTEEAEAILAKIGSTSK